MAFIRTERGDINPVGLGACYAHEHVLCSPPPDAGDRDMELDSEAAALQELTWFRDAGGRALVDMTLADYGRNAPGLRRVSEVTGIHIVATTGLHKEKFSGRFTRDKSVDELADHFTRDVMEGVDGTGVKARIDLYPVALHSMVALRRAE